MVNSPKKVCDGKVNFFVCLSLYRIFGLPNLYYNN